MQVHRAATSADATAAASHAQGRPLWVLVRDPHRHHWMDEAVRAVKRITDLVQTNNRTRPLRRRIMMDPRTASALGALTTLGGL